MKPIFQALYDANADVVIAGHNHSYERFAPQDPNGAPDAARGVRQFVVETGGKTLYPLASPTANLEKSNATTFGVLKLTLKADAYEWEFVSEEGRSFTDSGVGACH